MLLFRRPRNSTASFLPPLSYQHRDHWLVLCSLSFPLPSIDYTPLCYLSYLFETSSMMLTPALLLPASALLLLTTTPHVAAQHTSGAPVIREMYSTLYNYSSPGGADTKFVQKLNVNYQFAPGMAPNASVNNTGETPDVIGLTIYPNRNLQQVSGVGCGVTDSSSIVLQDLKAQIPEAYEEIMSLLWDQSDEWVEKGGIALTASRTPIGASDFAQQLYSYDDTVDCSPDPDLKLFNTDVAPKLWSTYGDIRKRVPGLEDYHAPWSAPAWMKDRDQDQACSMIGGKLKEDYNQIFAKYLVKSMVAIKNKYNGGKDPYSLSIQNEPLYLPPKYPGMLINSTRSARIGEIVRKGLDEAGLQGTVLSAYDHNWDTVVYGLRVFDGQTFPAYSRLATHCYGGDASALTQFTSAYPNVPQDMTECTYITQYGAEPWEKLREDADKLLNQAIEYGNSKIILWNCVLAVDDNGFTTPQLPGTCSNCQAPILVSKAKIQTNAGNPSVSNDDTNPPSSRRQNNDDGVPTYKLTSQYALLAHLSRAIRKRSSTDKVAVRTGIATTEEANNNPDGERIRAQAFKTVLSNGKVRWSVIVVQRNDHYLTGQYDPVDLVIGFRGMTTKIPALPVGLHTFVFQSDD